MSEVSFKRKRGSVFRFSELERRRFRKVTDAELEARALSDPQNPPLTKRQLDRMALARDVRLLREKIGLRQP
jgi:putative transcriptional regulator